VAVVAQSGGDYSDPITAMGTVSSWCGTPSASNPCLLKIMPGIFDLAGGTFAMQPYVDIEGAGEKSTMITTSTNNSSLGAVNGASNAEIRQLTVKNTGTGVNVYAFKNSNASPGMHNITAIGATSDGQNSIGVYNETSSPNMTFVNATASGGTSQSYGVRNNASSPTMVHVNATATSGGVCIGVENFGASQPALSSVIASGKGCSLGNYGMNNAEYFSSGPYRISVERSTIEGTTYSVFNDSEFIVRFANSRLIGPTFGPGPSSYIATITDNGLVTTDVLTGIGTTSPSAALSIVNGAAANKVLTVQGAAGQTAALQEWQDNAGTPVATVTPAGLFTGSIVIPDNSITSGKIVDGTIATPDLANGAVTSAKLATDCVGTTHIVDSSVTDAKIIGPISTAKLDLSTVQKKYAKVSVVAQSGGEFTSPDTAMASVASWCGTPSETNPCLLKIMPGVYDLAGSTLSMQPYVDIEGSGELNTVITTATNNSSLGTVNGANNAEIRHLTVKNTGTGINVYAFQNNNSSPWMTHITANAITSTGQNAHGVSNSNSSPVMTNLTIVASGGSNNTFGIRNNASSPIMTNVTANVTGGVNCYGIYNIGACQPVLTNVIATGKGCSPGNYGMLNTATSGGPYTVTLDRTTLEGSGYSISNDTEFIVKLNNSKLIGPAFGPGAINYMATATDNGLVTTDLRAGIGTSTPSAILSAVSNAAANKVLTVQGAVSQTANLQEWQNSSGSALVSVSAAGVITGNGSGLSNVTPADGSITDAKISGVISSTKLSSHSGDVTGTHAVTTVTAIQGRAVSAVAPATGDALRYNGSSWAPSAGLTGVTTGASSGLTGGGTSGNLSLNANFTSSGGNNGTATTVARGDHQHVRPVFAASNTANTTTIGSACTNYLSVSVTVPAAGTVAVEATNWISLNHANGTQDFTIIFVGSSSSDCGDYFGAWAGTVPAIIASGTVQQTASPRNVFTVSGAGTYTYYLNGYMSSGADASDWFYYARMFATYYPN